MPAQVAPGTPPEALKKGYLHQEVEGVGVYYPPGLLLNGPRVFIRLGGFWIFRWLRVDGIAASLAACAY